MFQKYLTTHGMYDSVIQLREGGIAEVNSRPGVTEPSLWTMGMFRAESGRSVHSHVWERHPAGSEVLCALSGAIEVYLRDHGEGSPPAVSLTAGQTFVVPIGQWHRLDVREPADLLAVTPRAGTEHEHVASCIERSE